MYSLSVSQGEQPAAKDARDLSVGELAVVTEDGKYHGHYVLRTYCGVVSLTDPEYTWSDYYTFLVRPCPPGTTITLTVK